MIKKSISVLLSLVMIVSVFALACCSANAESAVEQYLSSMTTEDKISQMIMPAFRYSTDDLGNQTEVTAITDDIAASLEKHSYAGVILFTQNIRTNADAVRLTDAMQKANAKVEGRPQLLITTDQEGGNVNRLGEGTVFPGNMALGAIGDLSVTDEVAGTIGGELSALGINADFAPVVDVNNNPANPVIGNRSFSDDPQVVAEHGAAFVKALNEKGVISTLKHFPGHGDTDTDSHTGLPCVNKSYEEIKTNELVPFKACIDAGSQMIMTAHIQYPQIEKNTYKSKSTGEDVYLPATLSKTIITDILRGDMGYNGVVITDSFEMDAIAEHFDKFDAAKLAIEAGVDIILIPVDTTTKAGFTEMDSYISTLAQKADNGEISMEKIDAAVKRILEMKEKNGLFTPYVGEDIEERVSAAVDSVGTKEIHDREWEITNQSLTLIKNDNNALPLETPNQKTVVIVPYDSEVLSMNFGARLLKRDGKLPEGSQIEVYSYRNKTLDDMLTKVKDADNIVFVSEIYGDYVLRSGTAEMADSLADMIHKKGGKFIMMSVSLPYDAARYQKSDAIVIAYLGESMSEDPMDREKGIKKYGPSMPAALYMLFDRDSAPTAKLPISIPKMDENHYYTDTVLYPRGFGLSYEPVETPATEVKLSAAKKIYVGSVAAVSAEVLNPVGATSFASSDNKIATVNSKGVVKGLKAGKVTITASNNGAKASVKITVSKRNNPVKITAKKTVAAYSKKKTVIKKAVTVKNAQGKVTYKTNNKKITVNNGTLTVAKGLKKGKTYSVKISVKVAGNNVYSAASSTIKIKIKVK